jgi:hypothetical protein
MRKGLLQRHFKGGKDPFHDAYDFFLIFGLQTKSKIVSAAIIVLVNTLHE